MKYDRSLLLTGGLSLALLISAGWLWQALSQTRYEAVARIGPPETARDVFDQDAAPEVSVAAQLLSSENLAAAADLLRERLISVPLASPFDSDIDFLAGSLRVESDDQSETDDVRIVATATEAEPALQILKAVVDAWLAETTKTAAPVADPAAAAAETERRQIAQAIERQQREIESIDERLKTAGDPLEPETADDLARLEGELVEIRRSRVEAERRLEDVRRELADKKLSVEAIVSRIADNTVRASVRERLNLAKLHDDLESQKAALQKCAAIYGSKHPRMAEIRARVEQLDQQLSALPVQLAGFSESSAVDLPTLVLQPLERDAAVRQEAEQELQSRLDGLIGRLTARQELERQLGESRQELAFLHSERDRARKQVESTRHDESSHLSQLIEPPTLASAPLAPDAGLPLTFSCLTGLGLCVAMFRQLQAWRRAPTGVPLPPAPAQPKSPLLKSPPSRERFRSHEEQQVRLKMLAANR